MAAKAACVVLLLAGVACATPLDDYIYNSTDNSYNWTDTGLRVNASKQGWTGYILNMTSQTWLPEHLFEPWPLSPSRSVWWHLMVVIVPDKPLKFKDIVLMYMTGGDNKGTGSPGSDPSAVASDEDVVLMAAVATRVGMVGAVLFQIPNQPCTFRADTTPWRKNRTEDALIAYTWNHFIDVNANTSLLPSPDGTANPEQEYVEAEWLLRFPMTKAGVRALDTLEQYVPKVNGDGGTPTRFIVAGASKRGWTTWTVGAVESARKERSGKPNRVAAICPLVLDILHFLPSIRTMYRKYGGWTFALKDYYRMQIMGQIGNDATTLLAQLVDPYYYLPRYTMPKLLVMSGGDEFLMPDDTWFYWDKLPGEKHMLLLQNAEHSLATGVLELIPAMQAVALGIALEKPRPSMNWTKTWTGAQNQTATLTAWSATKPQRVLMHHAGTLPGQTTRDFRLFVGNSGIAETDTQRGVAKTDCAFKIGMDGGCLHPVLWFEKDLKPEAGSGPAKGYTYTHTMTGPPKYNAKGYNAFMMEFRFPGADMDPDAGKSCNLLSGDKCYHYSTEVVIVPNTYPYQNCCEASNPKCPSGMMCDDAPLM